MFLLVSKFKTIYECYCTLCRVTPQKSEQKHITKNSDGLYNHCSAKYAINIVTKWCRDLGSQASFVQMLDSVYSWNKLLSVALISTEETNFVINRPFHVFFFNFWHGLVRKNLSTLLEKAPSNNEHVAPQNHQILQKFVWWETNVCKLSRLCRAIASHAWDVSLSNLAILLI